MKLKHSEARILIYLEQVDVIYRYAATMAVKLNMGYNYLLQLLHSMEEKGWVKRSWSKGKCFYVLAPGSPIKEAKEGHTQSELISTPTTTLKTKE